MYVYMYIYIYIYIYIIAEYNIVEYQLLHEWYFCYKILSFSNK